MYDVIVIGNDLSSLTAATLSSHHGRKTLYLTEHDIPEGNEESGYSFDNYPAPLTGFGPAQTCMRLFNELKVPDYERTHIRLLNPGLQIIMPEHRVELFFDTNELVNEMTREFKGKDEEIRKYSASVSKMSSLLDGFIRESQYLFPIRLKLYAHYIPALIREKITLLKALRSLCSISPLNRVFEAQIALLSNHHHEHPGSYPLMTSYVLNYPARGLYYFAGGTNRFIQILRDRFKAYGGIAFNSVDIRKVSVTRYVDIEIDSQGTSLKLRGKNLIVSVQWGKLRKLLFLNQKLKGLERRLTRVGIARYPFTVHLGVLEKGLPERMSPYSVVIADQNRPVSENNLIYLKTSESGDTACAPEGRRTLCASVFIKESPLFLNDGELVKICKEMVERVETFLPFLRENIDHINIGKSIERSRKYQEAVNQKYIMRADPILGIAALPNRTPMRNVFLTGGMLLASLGFEGEIVSGINAINLLIAKKERNDD